jgi:hypothetical protein
MASNLLRMEVRIDDESVCYYRASQIPRVGDNVTILGEGLDCRDDYIVTSVNWLWTDEPGDDGADCVIVYLSRIGDDND